MGLLRIQQELAAILMEPPARAAFAKDPRGSLRARGLRGRDLDLLAGLIADDLAYFAERRNIDRLQALRADAPRAMRVLEVLPGRARPYFRACPYSLEDPVAETRRLAAWCKAAARQGEAPGLLADLAAFDSAALRLAGTRPPASRASKLPRRAPGVVLLTLSSSIAPVLRGGDPAAARPGPSFMALHRTEDDVLWYALDALDHRLLRSARGQVAEGAWLKAAAAATGRSVAAARRAQAELARKGLLSPRAPAA